MPTTHQHRAEIAPRTSPPRVPEPPAPSPRSRRGTKILVVIGLIVLVASILGTGWVLNGHASDGKSSEAPITPAEVAYAQGFADVEGGIIDIRPEREGKVKEVQVKEGDGVKEGTVLFTLDDSHAKRDVKRAEAALANAKTLLEKAKVAVIKHAEAVKAQKAVVEGAKFKLRLLESQLERVRSQYQKSVASEAQKNQAEDAVNIAKQTVKAEEANLRGVEATKPQLGIDQAQQDIKTKEVLLQEAQHVRDLHQIKAPRDGKVLRLLVNVGELVGPKMPQPALIFCPNMPRIIRAEVEQEFAPLVQVGDPAVIQDDARLESYQWKGKVRSISDWYTRRRSILPEPRQFNDVRTLECIIELAPDQKPLRIGQKVRVIIGK